MSSSSSSRPMPKEIAELLMSKKSNVAKIIVSSKSGFVPESRVHLVFACTKGDESKDKGQVAFQKGTCYTNSYKNVWSCFANGDDEGLLKNFKKPSASFAVAVMYQTNYH